MANSERQRQLGILGFLTFWESYRGYTPILDTTQEALMPSKHELKLVKGIYIGLVPVSVGGFSCFHVVV